jgi:hypothetical protein
MLQAEPEAKMATQYVVSVYLLAFFLAVLVLYWFRPARWYWHVAAILLAFGIGIMPPQEQFKGPAFDLTVGAAFLFLIIWGCGEAVFHFFHLHHHQKRVRPAAGGKAA